MKDAVTIACKALAGGGLVVAFALLSETLEPKRFAGLFSAAPAVALAGMFVALLAKGSVDVHEAAVGMLAGCAGMLAYAAAVVPLLRRMGALGASISALLVWIALAALVAWALL